MIKVICVGKIKENFYKEAILEYAKRLSKYTKLEIIEVNDSFTSSCLKDESLRILKHIKDNDYVITLEIDGASLSSEAFASKLNDVLVHNSNIVFVIGGSYGLDYSVKKRSNYSLSFSSMTFPHQLFRVIFLEQLYRAYKIINNETYHK